MSEPARNPAPDNRTERGTFKKGQTGNPGGRPKGIAAKARELVGDDPERLLKVFLEVAENTGAKDSDRLTAAEKYMDRAWGKAPVHAPVEGGDPLDGLTQRVNEVLDELAAKRAAASSRKG